MKIILQMGSTSPSTIVNVAVGQFDSKLIVGTRLVLICFGVFEKPLSTAITTYVQKYEYSFVQNC